MVELNLYIKEVTYFLKTLSIKNTFMEEYIKNLTMERMGVVELNDEDNPYYLRLIGEYSPYDTPMEVTSVDTGATVTFGTGLIETDPKTYASYKIPNKKYWNLIARYPNQVDLIKSILYPVRSSEALENSGLSDAEKRQAHLNKCINAKNMEILSYDPNFLHPNEVDDLIQYLQRVLNLIDVRWDVRHFEYEEYYPFVFWALIWYHLPLALLARRIYNLRTSRVHPWHIWEYLTSKGMDDYRTILTNKQELFLYKNIVYLLKNGGKTDNLWKLSENLLADYGVTLKSKSLIHNLFESIEDCLATPEIISEDLDVENTPLQNAEDGYESVEQIINREYAERLEPDNSPYVINQQTDQFQHSGVTYLPTKLVELKKVTLDDSYLSLYLHFLLESTLKKMAPDNKTFSADITVSSDTLTITDLGDALFEVGSYVAGEGIPTGAKIEEVTGSPITSVKLDKEATTTDSIEVVEILNRDELAFKVPVQLSDAVSEREYTPGEIIALICYCLAKEIFATEDDGSLNLPHTFTTEEEELGELVNIPNQMFIKNVYKREFGTPPEEILCWGDVGVIGECPVKYTLDKVIDWQALMASVPLHLRNEIVESPYELLDNLEDLFLRLRHHHNIIRNTSDDVVHRAYVATYKEMLDKEHLFFNLVPGFETYAEWFAVDDGIRETLEFINEQPSPISEYETLRMNLVKALFPTDRESKIIVSGLSDAQYEGMKSLFTRLCSYNIAFLDTAREELGYIFSYPITVLNKDTRSTNTAGFPYPIIDEDYWGESEITWEEEKAIVDCMIMQEMVHTRETILGPDTELNAQSVSERFSFFKPNLTPISTQNTEGAGSVEINIFEPEEGDLTFRILTNNDGSSPFDPQIVKYGHEVNWDMGDDTHHLLETNDISFEGYTDDSIKTVTVYNIDQYDLIKELVLPQDNVVELPDMYKLTGLTRLHCANNPLTTVEYSALVNLTNLTAYNTNITEVDPYIYPELIYLDFRGCNVTDLPDLDTHATLRIINAENSQLANFATSSKDNWRMLRFNGCQMESETLNSLVDGLYPHAAVLGTNPLLFEIEDNPGGIDQNSLYKIEGYGTYVGSGLKDHGCSVSYDIDYDDPNLVIWTTNKSGTFSPSVNSSETHVWDIEDTRYETNTPSVALTGDTVEVRLLSSDNDYSCVTSLDLSNQGLVGNFPDMSKFTDELLSLNLSQNPITGSAAIEHLIGLEELYLNMTNLSGDLPPISLFPNLRELSISETNFNPTSLPDITGRFLLEKFWAAHCDYSGRPLPNFTGMVSLSTFHGNNANFVSYSGGADDLVACIAFIVSNCNLLASDLQSLVDDLWSIRTTLGSNGATLSFQNNNEPMPADAIAKIEGTGAYVGDGLITHGCTVAY